MSVRYTAMWYDVTQARQQEHTPYTQTRTGPAGRSSDAVQPSPPPAQLVCVCLSLCVVHTQCCRTGPAGIEQIRSLVSVSRLLLVAFPSP